MDGGLEGQTQTTITSATANATNWTISTQTSSTTKAIITDAANARSGNKYISFNNGVNPNGVSRIQSPLATIPSGSTYTIQYYCKALTTPLNNLTGAIYAGPVAANVIGTYVNGTTWFKVSATTTSLAAAGT